jgi:C1A family cysteine protease
MKFRRRLIRLARARPNLKPVQVLNLALSQAGMPRAAGPIPPGRPGLRVIRLARARPKLAPAAILRLANAKTVPGAQPSPRTVARFGWNPDLPDGRDLLYAAPYAQATNLPPHVDLRPQCPPVYDQKKLGSCTANAIAAAVEFIHKPQFMPSRLFIYYNERAMEGTIGTDSGAQIRDGIKSVAKQGVCRERDWPYAIKRFTEKPPLHAYGDALHTRATRYYRIVQDIAQMRGCLAEGFPFVFGFTVYAYFESQAMAKTGVLTMPSGNEQVVGGHAVMAVGYNDAQQMMIVRNSWAPTWGLQGYFKMPYAYITSHRLASDFWTIRQETSG